MTNITYIPGEIANAAIDEHGNRKPVTRTHHIFDDNLEKPQSEINQERIGEIAAETQRATQAEGVLDGKIATEKQRAEGVESGLNNRLGTVEQLAEISIGGGDAQIATGADFTNPDATKRAKVPTVGAVLDGLNDGIYDVSKRNPSGGPNSDGKFTLEYILSNADTLIPTSWRHGGMSISFVQSSDNKYVQFRYMGTSTANADFTNVENWQGIDIVLTPGSKNLVESGTAFSAVDELKASVFAEKYNEITDIYQTISGEYIDGNGELVSYNSYSVKLIAVEYGDILRVLGDSQLSSGVSPAYALYSSSDLSSSTLVKLGDYKVKDDFDTKVYVPQGANYLALVQHSQYLTVNAYTIEDITSLDVFNISEYNKSGNPEVFATYADISAALGTNGANVPPEKRKGGMFVTFINSTTEKYELHHLAAKDWSVEPNDWVDMDTSEISDIINSRILDASKAESINLSNIQAESLMITASGNWNTGINSKHVLLSCVKGDKFYIKANDEKNAEYAFLTSASCISGGAAPLVSGTSRNVLQSGESTIVTIPDGCNFLYILKSKVSYGTEVPGFLPSECYKIYDCSNSLDSLNELESEVFYNEYSELTPDSTISGKYIKDDGSLASSSVYSIKLVSLQNIEKVRIKGTSVDLSAANYAYAFYNSTDLSNSTFVKKSLNTINQSFDVIEDVPYGATVLALVQEYSTSSKYFTSVSSSVEKKSKLDEINDYKNNLIEYKKQGSTIIIGTYYKDKKMGVTIGASPSDNGLVDFRNIFTYDADSHIDAPTNISYLISAVGDMHAPFRFRSDNLTDEVPFTGGGHTYSNGTVKTAHLDSVEFFADGRLLDSNEIGVCRNIKIRWENSVKAGNAYAAGDEYALKEVHTLIFDGIQFEEWIDVIPLTDIVMGLWYGLEFIPVVNQSYVMFAGSAHRQKYGVDADHNSGDKTCNKVIIGNDDIRMSMSVDNTFDLGKGEFLITNGKYSTNRGRFVTSTKKSYFTIISSDYSVEMSEGLHYWLHGYYNFDE